ncbi:hypothetical protein BC830DRAFT_677349 [Chytriomyces sp. MP71]|nr:hypothetical protein BC830DRAFT_677349 [Chytriomyces sp. MP71]
MRPNPGQALRLKLLLQNFTAHLNKHLRRALDFVHPCKQISARKRGIISLSRAKFFLTDTENVVALSNMLSIRCGVNGALQFPRRLEGPEDTRKTNLDGFRESDSFLDRLYCRSTFYVRRDCLVLNRSWHLDRLCNRCCSNCLIRLGRGRCIERMRNSIHNTSKEASRTRLLDHIRSNHSLIKSFSGLHILPEPTLPSIRVYANRGPYLFVLRPSSNWRQYRFHNLLSHNLFRCNSLNNNHIILVTFFILLHRECWACHPLSIHDKLERDLVANCKTGHINDSRVMRFTHGRVDRLRHGNGNPRIEVTRKLDGLRSGCACGARPSELRMAFGFFLLSSSNKRLTGRFSRRRRCGRYGLGSRIGGSWRFRDKVCFFL